MIALNDRHSILNSRNITAADMMMEGPALCPRPPRQQVNEDEQEDCENEQAPAAPSYEMTTPLHEFMTTLVLSLPSSSLSTTAEKPSFTIMMDNPRSTRINNNFQIKRTCSTSSLDSSSLHSATNARKRGCRWTSSRETPSLSDYRIKFVPKATYDDDDDEYDDSFIHRDDDSPAAKKDRELSSKLIQTIERLSLKAAHAMLTDHRTNSSQNLAELARSA
jgi:hypothetical protein